MPTIRFLVQGSATEPYKVMFEKDSSDLSAFCTCPAGQNGQYCKHRFAIMNGLARGIVSNNAGEVSTVASWVPGTDVEAALTRLHEAEEELDLVKKRVSALKKDLARAMRN